MTPYETDPSEIPPADLYADIPSFGRYYPQPPDFKPDTRHIRSSTPESVTYWKSVLDLCTATHRIYEDLEPGRDVFALGTVIVKSSHLRGQKRCRDYTYADQNEVQATAMVRRVLEGVGVGVPEIYFAGEINGRAVLFQERIPGVGLNVAWPYLSQDQKMAFKQQARHVLRLLRTAIAPPTVLTIPSYVYPDLDPVAHRGIQERERSILFPPTSSSSTSLLHSSNAKTANRDDICFSHNDFSQSNIIVDDDKIVGIIDWEMAGFFAWQSVAEVHVEIRSPKRGELCEREIE